MNKSVKWFHDIFIETGCLMGHRFDQTSLRLYNYNHYKYYACGRLSIESTCLECKKYIYMDWRFAPGQESAFNYRYQSDSDAGVESDNLSELHTLIRRYCCRLTCARLRSML